MKKFLIFPLILLLVLGIAGCNSDKNDKDADSGSIAERPGSDSAITATASSTEQSGPSVTPTADIITPTVDLITPAVKSEGAIGTVEIDSEAIAKNVIGDRSTRKIYVYLPPSYTISDKSYPVVYFLHGYGDSSQGFIKGFKNKLDDQFNLGKQEFILVVLDGNNKTGGSFYVNSPASGNWEDFVVDEVVTYIDSNYRTIADSNSRGISGYSMGGFGAIYLALRHPDIYNSTMVFCPGVFAENELDIVMQSWRSWTDVKESYAQAFSPDVNNTTDYGNILKDEDITAQNQIWKDWMNGYSEWDQKLDAYLALNKPLKAIKIAYSDSDMFIWIPTGCKDLMKLMDERGITYSKNIFDGGHIVPSDAIENYFIPFFGENLTY